MSKKVRIGILGCANIAKKSAIKAFQALESAEVVSIASRDEQKAKEFSALFSIPTYESYESLINNPNVDAIYVPLPIGLHKEWIVKAAGAGKHVLSEKSLTTDLVSAHEIIDACRAAKVVLYENYMCDQHPQHQAVLSQVEKGTIGKPFLFRSYFAIPLMNRDSFRYDKKLGGSALTEVGGYTIFMARKILQSEPTVVTAKLFYDKENGIDMKGVGQLFFTDEIVAHIAFSLDSLYQNTYSILGTKGMINSKRAHTIPADMKPEIDLVTNENFAETVTPIDAPAANHFELYFNDFCKTILQKDSDPKKVEDIYAKVLSQAKVLEAIRISSREGRTVHMEEIH